MHKIHEKMTVPAVRLRHVKNEDINDLFKWRNHPDIRRNSFNTKPITWTEHENWFKKKSIDPNVKIYIAYYGINKIGSIRFEVKGDVIKINVMLNPDCLGKGFGAETIRLGTKKYISDKRPEKPLIAEIKPDNTASIKAFQKTGFKESHLTYVLKQNKIIL